MRASTLGTVPPEIQLPQFIASEADKTFLEAVMAFINLGDYSDATAQLVDQYFKKSRFPQHYDRLAITLYSPAFRRIMIVRPQREPYISFSQVLSRVFRFERLAEMLRSGLRIQLDFVDKPPEKVDYWKIGSSLRGQGHFEVGVDGLRIIDSSQKSHYFLPGDAYVRSIMSMQQLRQYLHKTLSKEMMKTAVVERFRSVSYISFDHNWCQLYRGHPITGAISQEKLEQALGLAIDHIKGTQKKNGRFLYYYDPASDSYRDHEHPNRDPIKNPYYNILRHGGGGLTCLFYEKYYRNGNTLASIKRTLDYLVNHTRNYLLDGEQASYIYYNHKAKLGGTGIVLYLAAEYQILTGDKRYSDWTTRLARHLQGEILPTGEFRYYYIYLDKLVSIEKNQEYFSFYYPGEAVCGLARYYTLAPVSKQQPLAEKLHAALKFMLEVRPNTRAEHYTKIPSDSWLMMGVNEMWKVESLRKPEYANFVFNDADKMITQMYQVFDAPYPDYVGAFYYEYGDYPYADGARCEGLLAAYELAIKMQETEKAQRYWQALKLAAWSLFHLVNTEQSLYSVPNPALSLGGIRFKYTRQWFRIDTIQHVASFYAKMLPHWAQNNEN